MATKKNVIVGAARVFIGPSMDPVNNAAGVTALRATTTVPQSTFLATNFAATWRDVGYTQDGLEVATDPSYTDVEVDQLLDAVKTFKDGMTLNISTTLVEATLENLLLAWGQPASTLTSTATDKETVIDGGVLGQVPTEYGLIAVGNGPEKAGSNAYQERSYFAYRVTSVEGASHTLSRADAVSIPVTFRALPADDGRYGFVRDRNNV